MAAAKHHPIRDLDVHTYVGADECLALIGRGTGFPFFRGLTEASAREAAEAFKADVIGKNEKSFVKRQAAADKLRKPKAEGR